MKKKIFKERTAFNFYRSYYEVFELLPQKDKLEFIESLLKAQFTGEIEEPESKLAKLTFKGQLHSITKQIKGFQKGKLTYPTGNPTKGKHKGNDKGNHKEVQVQEKEKVNNFSSNDYKLDLWKYFLIKIKEHKLDLEKVKIEVSAAFEYYQDLDFKNSKGKDINNLKTTIWNNWIKKDLDKFRETPKQKSYDW